jgi:hypothetical protein
VFIIANPHLHQCSGVQLTMAVTHERQLRMEDPRPSPDRPAKEPLAPIPEPQPHLPNPEHRAGHPVQIGSRRSVGLH